MKWFTRGRKKPTNPFVESTGGGWTDPPDVIEIDGGAQAAYIGDMLAKAKQQAVKSVEVGESFTFTMTDIPVGVGPHEIMLPLMFRASDYGLDCQSVINEKVDFVRRD